jgi:AcrR family transcriptional regulator
MASVVKSRRKYDSPRRRAQAEATRTAILEAAERLFTAHGFAATSMPAVAADAGVALKTVYATFATKAGVLHALWDLRLGGDDERVPVVDRPWYLQLLQEDDPERLLRATARQSRTVKDRAGPVMQMVREAAGTEPLIADLWQRIETEFRSVLGGLAERLGTLGALAPAVDTRTATDILWTLNHPDTWHLLVVRCRWTSGQYEQWVATTLIRQLLNDSSPEP